MSEGLDSDEPSMDPTENLGSRDKSKLPETELRQPDTAEGETQDYQDSGLQIPVDTSSLFVGRFEMIRCLGEGGMGSVWEALQHHPVRRVVALKLIKYEILSPELKIRFESERQALALMDHPYIAKILDAGTTEEGRPYFVMELVQGEPLDEFCNRRRLGLEKRLKLFADICSAIQHAHQKGIVHRDLKPNNILVSVVDGRVIPKIIDFGLAKTLQNHTGLSKQGMATEAGQILGTVRYMSPEQAGLSNEDIDTRSDVYSLGVVLYELLTGTTPLDRNDIRGLEVLEILRRIREEDPELPSRRLFKQSTEQLLDWSTTHGTTTSKFRKSIEGDIDRIVITSLAVERDRRYGSVQELSADIHRFLHDEPISARPPSRGYLFKKFLKKNRYFAIAASVVLLVLFLGIAGTSVGMFYAKKSEADAKFQKENAEKAEEEALKQKGIAQAAEKEAAEQRDEAMTIAAKANLQLAISRMNEGRVVDSRRLLTEIPAIHRNIEWYLQNNLVQGSEFSIDLSGYDPRLIEWNADGDKIYVAGKDFISVSIFDEFRIQPLLDFQTKPDSDRWMNAFRMSGIGGLQRCKDPSQILVLASVRAFWHLNQKNEDSPGFAQTRHESNSPVVYFAYSPEADRQFILYKDGSIWSLESGSKSWKQIVSNGEAVDITLASSPDGNRIAYMGHGKVGLHETTFIEVLDLQKNETVFRESCQINTRVSFSPNGKELLLIDSQVRILDAKSGRTLRQTRELNTRPRLRRVRFSPDGRWIALVDGKVGEVTLLDAANLAQVTRFSGHEKEVTDLKFSPDGSRLATLSGDNWVKIYRLDDFSQSLVTRTEFVPWMSTKNQDEESSILVHSNDRLYELSEFGIHQEQKSGKQIGTVLKLFHAPNGFFAKSFFNRVEVFKNQSIESGPDFVIPTGFASAYGSFSDDGRFLALANQKQLMVWNTEAAKLHYQEHHASQKISGIQFLPDSKDLLVFEFLKSFKVDMQEKVKISYQPLEDILVRGTRTPHFCFSPDGSQVFLPINPTHGVFDLKSGKTVFTLENQLDLTCSYWSRDGSRLVVGDSEGLLSVLDARTGERICYLQAHESKIVSLVVNEESGTIYTSSEDHTVKKWLIKDMATTLLSNIEYQAESQKNIYQWQMLQFFLSVLESNEHAAEFYGDLISKQQSIAEPYTSSVDVESVSSTNRLTILPLWRSGQPTSSDAILRYRSDAMKMGRLFPGMKLVMDWESAWVDWEKSEPQKAFELAKVPSRIPKYDTNLPRHIALLALINEDIGNRGTATSNRNRLRQFLFNPKYKNNTWVQFLAEFVDSHLKLPAEESVANNKDSVAKNTEPQKTPDGSNAKQPPKPVSSPSDADPKSKAEKSTTSNKPSSFNAKVEMLETLFKNARYTQTVKLGRQLLEELKNAGDDTKPIKLARMKVLNRVGFCERTERKNAEALKCFEEASSLSKELLNEKDSLALEIQNNLAATYWSLKQYEKAINLFRKNLALKTEVLGRKSYSTQMTVANLGVNLLDAGKAEEAVPFLEEASQSPFSEKFDWVFASLRNAYLVTDKMDLAKQEILRSVEESKKKLKASPSSLVRQMERDSIDLYRAHALDDAEKLIREALELAKKLDPRSMASMTPNIELARILIAKKESEEAKKILIDIFDKIESNDSVPSKMYKKIKLQQITTLLTGVFRTEKNQEQLKYWQSKRDSLSE